AEGAPPDQSGEAPRARNVRGNRPRRRCDPGRSLTRPIQEKRMDRRSAIMAPLALVPLLLSPLGRLSPAAARQPASGDRPLVPGRHYIEVVPPQETGGTVEDFEVIFRLLYTYGFHRELNAWLRERERDHGLGFRLKRRPAIEFPHSRRHARLILALE